MTAFGTTQRARTRLLTLIVAAAAAACSDSAERGSDIDPDAGATPSQSDEELVDYEAAFPQDRVPRIDIVMSAANHQALQDDMTSMLGEPGTGQGFGGGFPAGGMGGFMPPAELTTACASLAAGATCEAAIFGMTLSGTCSDDGSGGLICQPAGFPGGGAMLGGAMTGGAMMGGGPGGGGFGLGSVDLVPNTPIYVECEVRVGERAWQHVGFRYKGNSSLATVWQQGVGKLPFRLKFDEYEDSYPELLNQRFFGFQLLSFSNAQGDSSLVRGKLAAEIFANAGIGTAHSSFYRVYVDRGEGPLYMGLYTVSEIPSDDAFLERAFGSDEGNLYKPDGNGARWQAYDEGSLEKENHEDEADFSDTQALYDALHADRSDAAQWRAGLEAVFNVDLFLQWLAVNTVIQDWDQYGQMPHNYYLYSDPGDGGRFAWIPWDHSLSMQGGFGGQGASLSLAEVTEQWPLIRYLLDDAVYRQVYRDHVAGTIEGPFEPEATIARFREAHALVAPYVTGAEGEQPGFTLLGSPADFDDALEQLVAHVRSRAQAVSEFLATP